MNLGFWVNSGVCAAALVTGLSLPNPAAAQAVSSEPEAQQTTTVGEIVVTARRRAENIQDVPISVTALTGETLANEGITDITGIQGKVPSLTITNAGVQRDSFTFAIRGQRTSEIQLLTDPPVGLYFAEVVQPRPFGFGNTLYDIGSVQVLKGVQGTLFGRNVTGGAVLVEPNRPKDVFEAEVQAQAGNYDMRNLYGMVNVPLGDWGAFRVAAKTHRRDGFVTDQQTGRDYDDQSYDSLRASLTVRPTSAIESTTVVDLYRSRQNGTAAIPEYLSLFNTKTNKPTVLGQLEGTRAAGAAGLAGPASPLLAQLPNLPAQLAAVQAGRRGDFFSTSIGIGDGNRLDAFGGASPYADLDNNGVTNRTTFDLGFATLKNVFGYREIKYDRLSDLDGFDAHLIEANQITDIQQYSNELQLEGEWSRLNYTLGAYYFLEKGTDGNVGIQFPELTALGLAGAGRPINPFTVTGREMLVTNLSGGRAESYAAYAAGSYELTDTLKLSGGLRYNFDERTITTSAYYAELFGGYCLLDLDNNGAPDPLTLANCKLSRTNDWDAMTWDLTLQYEPNPGLTGYASTRKGYRSGGYNLRAQSDAAAIPFDPEDVQEYEVGLKTRNTFKAATLTTSWALFYQDYSNVQKQNVVQTSSGLVATIVTNTTAQENYGGEVEASLYLDNGLTLNGSYSYVDANILEGGNGTFDLIGVPHHQLGFNVSYAADLPNGFGALQANASAAYKSSMHLDDLDVEGDQPAYTLVNLRLQISDIKGSRYSVAAFGNNVFDERYRVGVAGLMNDVGFLTSIYGEPATYGLEVSAKF